jgi:aldose 1-epimerase
LQSITKDQNTIVLKKGTSIARISLNDGGSLSELLLNDTLIIHNFNTTVPYGDSFASAILFPFSNRVYNGEYSFSNKKYHLDTNGVSNDAIHGLVYNKPFIFVDETIEMNQISATIAYRETQKNKGFPFLFSIYMTYTLSEESLSLKVTVKNEDATSFPFTIGWHPYFYTKKLQESTLKLDIDKEIIHNEEMIPIKVDKSNIPNNFKIGDQKFDHCYALKNNSIHFGTPDYSIELRSSFDKNYAQIYTPEIENHIAIEPITGPSNSFNNQLGLQVLKPNTDFSIQWTIQLQHD